MIHQVPYDEQHTTIICIDSFLEEVPNGRLYSPGLPRGSAFSGVMPLLQLLEQTLDTMAVGSEQRGTDCLAGECATFALRILFRQNGSWQGWVTWLEGRQEQNFRSVLELVQFLHRVLTMEMSA